MQTTRVKKPRADSKPHRGSEAVTRAIGTGRHLPVANSTLGTTLRVQVAQRMCECQAATHRVPKAQSCSSLQKAGGALSEVWTWVQVEEARQDEQCR